MRTFRQFLTEDPNRVYTNRKQVTFFIFKSAADMTPSTDARTETAIESKVKFPCVLVGNPDRLNPDLILVHIPTGAATTVKNAGKYHRAKIDRNFKFDKFDPSGVDEHPLRSDTHNYLLNTFARELGITRRGDLEADDVSAISGRFTDRPSR